MLPEFQPHSKAHAREKAPKLLSGGAFGFIATQESVFSFVRTPDKIFFGQTSWRECDLVCSVYLLALTMVCII